MTTSRAGSKSGRQRVTRAIKVTREHPEHRRRFYFLQGRRQRDEVIFTLADGTTTITIPKATSPAPLGITFSLTESVNVLPGKSYEIGYTLSGADEQTVIDVVAQNGYRADVVKTDYQSGKIVITAPETAADDRIIVLVSDGNDRTLMRFINVAESIIRITTDSYTIESDGGTQAVEVETNIDYTVHIAESDREWVSLAPETRAAVHTETLNFTFHAQSEYDLSVCNGRAARCQRHGWPKHSVRAKSVGI